MWRASLLLLAVAVADAKPKPVQVSQRASDPHRDPHAALATQLAAESDTIGRTIATVGDKLHAADNVRVRRVHAAIRILHAPLPDTATPDERMASARRRAAARLLLERDAAERGLLADEVTHLEAAARVVAAATEKIPTITLPTELELPSRGGKIARRFGDYVHERSKATLSRRGIDLEVDDNAPAIAPADGTVRYAGPIRGLDHGVILDHGDYLTIIAKLGELTLPIGSRVARGDRLGRAAHHRVYVEVRAKVGPGGLPIDPEPLFKR